MTSRSRLLDFCLISVLAAISAYIYKLSLTHRASISGDFPYYVQFAEGLSLDPSTFDPMGVWPLGYPLALRALSGLGSWQEVGSLIGFLALLTIGIASFFLLKTAYGSIPSFLGALVSVFNPAVVKYAVGQSSDLPALALAFVCIGFFVYWFKRKSNILLFFAGIFAGLAYLARYSSLSVLLSLLLVLLLIHRPSRSFPALGGTLKTSIVNGLILLAGWSIAASPQLIGSLIVHGNPLYTENGCNIALALGWNKQISGLTWLNVKDSFPQCASIFKIISDYPAEFIANYFRNIGESLNILRGHSAVALFTVYAGFFASRSPALKSDEQNRFIVLTMLINAVAIVLITSLAFVSDRHLILSTTFVACIGVAAVASYLSGLAGRFKSIRASGFALPLSLLALFFVLSEFTKSYAEQKKYRVLSSETKRNMAVKNALESFGCVYLVSSDKGVVNTVLVGDDFVDPSSIRKMGVQEWRNQYTPFQNLPAAKRWMQANGFNCIVLDEPSIGGRIPGVDYGLWKKEFDAGVLFPRRWSSKNSKTFVFAIK
jgi:hypothetical protein